MKSYEEWLLEMGMAMPTAVAPTAQGLPSTQQRMTATTNPLASQGAAIKNTAMIKNQFQQLQNALTQAGLLK